jgi:hypothetical protein
MENIRREQESSERENVLLSKYLLKSYEFQVRRPEEWQAWVKRARITLSATIRWRIQRYGLEHVDRRGFRNSWAHTDKT